ncbi:unnamed protein product [Amoebophrya sp. A120]|nr:unnamed protein product [Amoebophrya sp. A120]|eukprot:GSA120T00016351001.1
MSTAKASMQGGPTSTAPTKIPKKRPLSSSNGHAVQWRTKEERTAEEENRKQVLANSNMRKLNQTSSTGNNNISTTTSKMNARAGNNPNANDITMSFAMDPETADLVDMVNANSATSVEEQLIEALKTKVNMLENENKMLLTNAGNKTSPAGQIAAGGVAPTSSSSDVYFSGGPAATAAPAQNSNPGIADPLNLKWAPAHTEKLVLALHESEQKNKELLDTIETQKLEIKKHSNELVDCKDNQIPMLKKHQEVLKTRIAELEKQAVTDLNRIQELVDANQKQQKEMKKQTILCDELKIENRESTKRITELQTDVDSNVMGRNRVEQELNTQLSAKSGKLSDLELEKKELEIIIAEKDKQLQKLDSYQKALLMPAGENLLLKQLQDLRKEQSQTMSALQAKVSDLAEINDKCIRYESYQKNLLSEIASLKQELQTKTEFSQLLQQKNQMLDLDQMEKKQQGQLIEQYKAELLSKQALLQKQYELNDELSARLYSVYETVPAEAVEAWLEPERRKRKESEAVAEMYFSTYCHIDLVMFLWCSCIYVEDHVLSNLPHKIKQEPTHSYKEEAKRLQTDQASLSIEVAHLQTKLTAASEQEQRLQKKVVEQTMRIEELLGTGA